MSEQGMGDQPDVPIDMDGFEDQFSMYFGISEQMFEWFANLRGSGFEEDQALRFLAYWAAEIGQVKS